MINITDPANAAAFNQETVIVVAIIGITWVAGIVVYIVTMSFLTNINTIKSIEAMKGMILHISIFFLFLLSIMISPFPLYALLTPNMADIMSIPVSFPFS